MPLCRSQSSLVLRAFTLTECLVAVAIVGVLTALLIPLIGSIRESAHISQCRANLHQLGIAYGLYLPDNRDRFPPYYDPPTPSGLSAVRPYVDMAGAVPTQRVMECPTAAPVLKALYTNSWYRNSYEQNRGWTGFNNSPTAQKDRKSFSAPSRSILVYERWGQADVAWPTPNTHATTRNVLYVDFHVESRPDLIDSTALNTALKQE